MQAAREEAVTAEVLASFGGAAAPRYQEIMQSLVRHLHAFPREVRLTEAEWQRGIEFLTRPGTSPTTGGRSSSCSPTCSGCP